MVKALDLRSNGRMSAWVRTPLLVDFQGNSRFHCTKVHMHTGLTPEDHKDHMIVRRIMLEVRFEPHTLCWAGNVHPQPTFAIICTSVNHYEYCFTLINQGVWGSKPSRCEQDSNLRGETPFDFESNALTTRPSQP